MYDVEYYRRSWNGDAPAREYILNLTKPERAKLGSHIDLMAETGYLGEPYTKKVIGTSFRELIVDCGNLGHRIFYFTTSGRRIILLHAFLKKTRKTPPKEIERGKINYNDFVQSQK